MILYTKQYKVNERKKKEIGVQNSKSIIQSTEKRKVHLQNIRFKEAKLKEQDFKRIPYNKVSDFFGISGIYFLMQSDLIVYVGETSCLITRLGQHIQDKEFDGFRFLKEPDTMLRLRLEKAYIKKYAPMYNINHNPNIALRAPLIRHRTDLSQLNID